MMAGSMWEGIIASGIAAAVVSLIVSLINRSRAAEERQQLTYWKIANDYEIWNKHAQGSAWSGKDYMTRERFEKLSSKEKIQILTDRYGPENWD